MSAQVSTAVPLAIKLETIKRGKMKDITLMDWLIVIGWTVLIVADYWVLSFLFS